MGGLSIERRNEMAAERRTLSLLIGDLERKGFIYHHAVVLARVLISNSIDTTDGIRFELSGTLTSIFDERGDKRRDEWAAMESEHRRRMWLDVYTPFLVGMASIAWCVGVIYFGGSEWVACLALPGVAWCQYKLAPFMWGGNHSS